MRFPGRKKQQQYTCDTLKGELLTIGKYTYGEPDVRSFDDITRLVIGKYCSISDRVVILLGGNHRLDWGTTYPFSSFPGQWPEAAAIPGHPATKGDIIVGNDVWIGFGATILSGVKIGDGAVIGAGSVVSRDVAPYTVVAGNSAVSVRKRFSEPVIAALLNLCWWDWPDEKVRENVHPLCSSDMKALLCAGDM
ncbi:MAG: CatB-related O-acetyltransferase [Deltaproteobacteria bacterium]|nr:CatB-related O-acetyltransferase [Deltaproteobacteria bacterium]